MPYEIQLGTIADVDGLMIILMHVVDKGKVVVGVPMSRVKLDARLEVLHSQSVRLFLKVGKAKIILDLGILWI